MLHKLSPHPPCRAGSGRHPAEPREGTITPRTRQPSAQLLWHGVVIVPATGRPAGQPAAVWRSCPASGMPSPPTVPPCGIWARPRGCCVQPLFQRCPARTSEPRLPAAPPDAARLPGKLLPSRAATCRPEHFLATASPCTDSRRALQLAAPAPPTVAPRRASRPMAALPILRDRTELDEPATPPSKNSACSSTAPETDRPSALPRFRAVPGVRSYRGRRKNVEVTAAGVDKGEALLRSGRPAGHPPRDAPLPWATARTTAPCCKRPGWPL